MTNWMSTVVVVGGGTAGWLTAAVVAAERRANRDTTTQIVLIESPDIPTIGVGEGTWPSLRQTLRRIGLAETELFRSADASFKQGTRFVDWASDDSTSSYYHPFSLPVDYSATNLAPFWLADDGQQSFAAFVTPQSVVLDGDLAPKQASTPEYAFAVNYAYHLDAGKFAHLLQDHAVRKLGVRHIRANVTSVVGDNGEDIRALRLDSGELVQGSLFVDCTGHRALLLGEHFGVEMESVGDVLFNDSAIAVQVAHAQPQSAIASTTVSTATPAGWIWDIGLQSRRGIGHVYASKYCSEGEALERLRAHIASDLALDGSSLTEASFRTLRFQPGYRREFWVRNCVAVGLSAGFVEPLEASAIALIEQSAAIIARQLPVDRQIMDVVAQGFNDKMRYHWMRIVEFLKLHYAVSARNDTEYWRAHRDPASWPAGLKDKLVLWQQQAPYHFDAPMLDELFPSASYQYVLYGMGFKPKYLQPHRVDAQAQQAIKEVQEMGRKLVAGLPSNRSLIQNMLTGNTNGR